MPHKGRFQTVGGRCWDLRFLAQHGRVCSAVRPSTLRLFRAARQGGCNQVSVPPASGRIEHRGRGGTLRSPCDGFSRRSAHAGKLPIKRDSGRCRLGGREGFVAPASGRQGGFCSAGLQSLCENRSPPCHSEQRLCVIPSPGRVLFRAPVVCHSEPRLCVIPNPGGRAIANPGQVSFRAERGISPCPG